MGCIVPVHDTASNTIMPSKRNNRAAGKRPSPSSDTKTHRRRQRTGSRRPVPMSMFAPSPPRLPAQTDVVNEVFTIIHPVHAAPGGLATVAERPLTAVSVPRYGAYAALYNRKTLRSISATYTNISSFHRGGRIALIYDPDTSSRSPLLDAGDPVSVFLQTYNTVGSAVSRLAVNAPITDPSFPTLRAPLTKAICLDSDVWVPDGVGEKIAPGYGQNIVPSITVLTWGLEGLTADTIIGHVSITVCVTMSVIRPVISSSVGDRVTTRIVEPPIDSTTFADRVALLARPEGERQ